MNNGMWGNNKGFTLIEVMISLVILGVVLTGVVQMFITTSRQHTSQEMMVTTTQDLRATKLLMTQEIREAGLDPTLKAAAGFLDDTDDSRDTDADSVHITRDMDGDENTGGANEDISYCRTNDTCQGAIGAVLVAGDNTPGCLRRDSGGGRQAIMPNVTNLQFLYYDDMDAVIPPGTRLDEIRNVEVTLAAQVENPDRAAERIQTLQFRIFPRNM